MTKRIKFIPNYESINEYIDFPKPAKYFIPDWYKKSTRFMDGNKYTINESNIPDIKSCIPFLDSLSSGYIQTIWFDIQVESDNDHAFLKWNNSGLENVWGTRLEDTARHMPKPNDVTKDHYIFKYPYSIKTPPGYSTIFTQPFNRFDSPFIALTGIVDTDTLITNGNYPIFIRKNYSGVVRANTPILQMIPFKRDSWVSNVEEYENNKDYLKQLSNKIACQYGYYKNFIWKRKEYN